MNILQAYQNLKTTSGTNDKIGIVTELSNNATVNDIFARFVSLIYDPKYNFYMTLNKKDINLEGGNDLILTDEEVNHIIYSFNEMMYDISKNLRRGNVVKEEVISFINGIENSNMREMLFNAVNRNLKVGLNVKSINKAFGFQLIEEVPYMRCSTIDSSNWKTLDWKDGVYVQLKADGMFANVSLTDGEWTFRSRNGSVFPKGTFTVIEQTLNEMISNFDVVLMDSKLQSDNVEDYVFSGELLVLDEDYNVLDRSTGNGILNSLLQTGLLKEEYSGLSFRFVMWDLYLKDYKKDKSTYRDRFETLFEVVNNNSALDNYTKFSHLKIIDSTLVYSPEDVHKITVEYMGKGEEGTIVKNPKAKFKNGTSKDFIKMKVEFECDLVVTGWIEGKGKNENTFGSLVCESSDSKLVVNVSGFTDKQREEIAKDIDNYMGKIITVKANDIISNYLNDKKALYLPRFVEFRLDKDTADSLPEIENILKSITKV